MTFQIRLAGACIKVTSLYDEARDLCRSYLDEDGTPDLSLRITPDDLREEAVSNHEAWPATAERAA